MYREVPANSSSKPSSPIVPKFAPEPVPVPNPPEMTAEVEEEEVKPKRRGRPPKKKPAAE